MDYEIYGYDPPYRSKNMMPGMIMLWHGSVATIPSGWHLCDGTVGTPDLRDRFVMSAGTTYNPGDNDANPTHDHDFTGNGHFHSVREDAPPTVLQSGPNYGLRTTTDPAVGTTDPVLARPPYYVLCFIMKL